MAEDRGPLNLDEFLRLGGVLSGRKAESLLVRLEDGTVADLPAPPAPGEAGLTPTQRKILAALRESPVPLSRKTVAAKIGRGGRDGASGKLGGYFRDLLSRGEIFESAGLLTDDARKFAETT